MGVCGDISVNVVFVEVAGLGCGCGCGGTNKVFCYARLRKQLGDWVWWGINGVLAASLNSRCTVTG